MTAAHRRFAASSVNAGWLSQLIQGFLEVSRKQVEVRFHRPWA